jgi:hypothetical protein
MHNEIIKLAVQAAPLGCMPHWRWKELQSPFYSLDALIDRHNALDHAIKRRLVSDLDPLPEWVAERRALWYQIVEDKKWANDPIGINALILDRLCRLTNRILVSMEDLIEEISRP